MDETVLIPTGVPLRVEPGRTTSVSLGYNSYFWFKLRVGSMKGRDFKETYNDRLENVMRNSQFFTKGTYKGVMWKKYKEIPYLRVKYLLHWLRTSPVCGICLSYLRWDTEWGLQKGDVEYWLSPLPNNWSIGLWTTEFRRLFSYFWRHSLRPSRPTLVLKQCKVYVLKLSK